jgi:hypothetical protein
MTFTPGQTAALRKLRELWRDTPFVLVGASAPLKRMWTLVPDEEAES